MSRIAKLLLLVAVLLLPFSITTAQDDELVDQTFLLTFIPNIQFSPTYAAIANGHFAEAGFNVTIEHLDEPVVVDLIASNQRQFGIVSGEQVIMARSGGRPIVYLYEWFQQYPVGVVIPENSDIETVADLAGRNVGIPGRFGASYSGLTALLATNGLTEQDIDLEEIGFFAPDVVCVGGVEASVVYLNNEPLQIEQRAEQGECGDVTGVRVLPVAAEVDLVSNGLVTNEETIANQPEMVAAFVAAYHQGLQDVINNPAEAYLISLDYVDNLPISDELQAALEAEAAAQEEFLATNPDREAIAESRQAMYDRLHEQFSSEELIQLQVLLKSIELWDAEQLGVTELASWEAAQNTLLEMGFLNEPIDLEAAFTNEFVPGFEE
ncbi:MAG: hypothetical protein D6712_00740 [Chloroflexi bacterium]|nr:MAG: hypothetical protein D6712_00740 [Chloroflexota bacterium]